MPQPRVIYWFRTDLRLHDSPALKAALDLSPSVLYPIFTWDPHYVYRARVGPNRWQFLLDCQNDLSSSITALNPNSKLLVLREAPQTLFPKLFKEWDITHLVFEKDTDAYARERDEEVMQGARRGGVEVVVVKGGRTLYDPEELVEKNKGKPTMSISQVQAAGAKIGEIPKPIPAPTSLPDPGNTKISFAQEGPGRDPDLNATQRVGSSESSYSAGIKGPNNDFAIPTLAELNLKPSTTPHRGGETLALQSLQSLLSNPTDIATFSKPNTAPTSFSPQSTTLLSPHLHFGSLSAQEFYWQIQSTLSKYPGTPTKPPTSLIGQLLFRDMYFGAQAALGHTFAQTYGNPYCRFIPWHLPSISPATHQFKPADSSYTTDSAVSATHLHRWKHGLTGFPFVDALMRQLKSEGWIHHLGRHMVACFLTRGGCYVDWERGAEVFEEWLIDHETACNVGNWQWLACTAFYHQFYRVYSPVAFGKKWDPEGEFVRRYVPELKRYDKRFVYEPWKAPVADQRRWGCIVRGDGSAGTDSEGDLRVYPKPVFDFDERRAVCIQAMKKAYKVGLYGNDANVLDGSWGKLFPDDAEGPTEGNRGFPGTMIRDEKVSGEELGKEHRSREAKTYTANKKDHAGSNATKRGKSQTTLDGLITRKKIKSL